MRCNKHQMIRKWFNNIGPGTLIAAAFIGPGTITVCTIAGESHGVSLLWAMLLSIIITVVLQEMTARVGLVSGKGLAQVVKDSISNRIVRLFILGLIIAAIFIGNVAYEAGNISGGVIGLELLFNQQAWFPVILGIIAFSLLMTGSYKVIERVLVVLVIIMGISFIGAAIAIRPSIIDILKGLFTPSITADNLLTVTAIVGTTVVPYNLFLHASLVNQKWNNTSDLKAARKDTIIAVFIGGIVSMAIIIAGSTLTTSDIPTSADLATSLEPIYGDASNYVFAIGIFSAGLTSAITAPLAAAYVLKECLGWNVGMKDIRFRISWMIVLVIGVLFASLGFKPVAIITFAQIANAILLPVIAILLIVLVNSKLMGSHKNKLWLNVVAAMIVLFCMLLGVKSLIKVFEWL